MKRSKKNRDVLTVVEGMYKLSSSEYVFIKGGRGKPAKIVLKKQLLPTDKVIFCDRCHTLPAIQLDNCYMEGYHDFTLCQFCIESLKEI